MPRPASPGSIDRRFDVRVVFVGAGSVVFTRNLTRDILTFPELGDCEIVLMDIDAHRLSRAEKLVSRMAETAKSAVRIIATTDRGWDRPVGIGHTYPGKVRGEPVCG
jgi:predicted RNA-binding protein associated with RNAse of E/G family